MNLFSNFIEKVTKYSWRGMFEHTRRLKGLLSRVPLIVSGRLSVEVGLAMTLFVKRVLSMYRKSGPLFTALYLKQCSVALQRYYAGNRVDKEMLPIYVSLTRSGIPRIIPEVCSLMKTHFNEIRRKSFPWISTIPLEKGLVWEPTWKATPNDDRIFVGRGLDLPKGWRKAVPNIFTSMKYEIASFAENVNFIHSLQAGVFSPGILFAKRTLFALDNRYTTQACNQDLEYYERAVGLGFSSVAQAYAHLWPGRLASVIEGAGKRRIFAIGNYIKQRLLHPVHVWAMKVLALLPQDGTFDQQKPITNCPN
ncbi:hypothetical protein TIFTF001_045135 [Ficus carica]|uniref:Uncharacterized protein n=1 Tax=Ficus carica TaxID=3494 RepID=A0AA88CJT4_FICCA|nr:hypothetical protein TIFTF001_045135 [Ficus carica]